jgi:ketosteroid isomerase-like protein
MAHPNEELVRKGYGAFAKGDLNTLGELFADDIQWHTPGQNQLAGDLKGKDEVFGQFAKIAELTGGNFSLEIHAVLADDEHAVALVVARGERDGKKIEDRQVHVFHVKGGKVTEFWGHPTDQRAIDDFWG